MNKDNKNKIAEQTKNKIVFQCSQCKAKLACVQWREDEGFLCDNCYNDILDDYEDH